MSLERIPDFSESIRRYLRRSEWGDFPDVVIHSDESLVKKHQLHASAKLKLGEETLQGLKEKHGTELEKWWIATFGYGFERLTESEARYLFRADNADLISERIVAARGEGD